MSPCVARGPEHVFYIDPSLPDHMYIEEYIEEDEEPPLLLRSCPSHGKYVLLCACKTYDVCSFQGEGVIDIEGIFNVCVCVCPPGVWLWWDCSSAVSVGGRVCVSAMPCWPGAFEGEIPDNLSDRGSMNDNTTTTVPLA